MARALQPPPHHRDGQVVVVSVISGGQTDGLDEGRELHPLLQREYGHVILSKPIHSLEVRVDGFVFDLKQVSLTPFLNNLSQMQIFKCQSNERQGRDGLLP